MLSRPLKCANLFFRKTLFVDAPICSNDQWQRGQSWYSSEQSSTNAFFWDIKIQTDFRAMKYFKKTSNALLRACKNLSFQSFLYFYQTKIYSFIVLLLEIAFLGNSLRLAIKLGMVLGFGEVIYSSSCYKVDVDL